MEVSFKHTERVNIHTQHRGWGNRHESGFMYYKARLDSLKDGTYAVRLKDGGVFVEYTIVDGKYHFKMASFFDKKLIVLEFDEEDHYDLIQRGISPRIDWMYDYIASGEHRLNKKTKDLAIRAMIRVYLYY